jgi:ubiquinone biosynthesis protein
MLKPSDTPTRLLDPRERPAVVIAEPNGPSRYRSLYVVGKFAALFLGVAGLAIRRQFTIKEYARRVRGTFEEIGGLWIKFGQLLSLRIDVFPTELCRELARMQERTVGFPPHIARAILEAELGAPVEQYFDEFEDSPFATVPMGQVHRARLRREGVWVAVKVQQPYSAELFARDLQLIQLFARTLVRLRVRLHLRWEEGVAELQEIMSEDLDFRFEASSMRRMQKTLADQGIAVPDVFSDYCTPRVLVSEFIHAVLMSDYLHVRRTDPGRLQSWLVENTIDPQSVAQNLFDSMFRQIFEDNLYHGDMRPGNIVLLRNSRLAVIDFRTVNFTEREYLQKYRLFIRALATRDYAKAADLALMLCAILPHVDVELAKDQVIRALRAWATRTLVKELPYHERSIDHATAEVVRVLYGYKCTMGWFWLRIHRAMSTLDDSLAVLSPNLNHTKRALRYFRRANERSAEGLVGRDLYSRIVGGVRSAMDIQERISEYTMFQGSIIRRNARVFQAATNKVADALAAFVGVLAVAILFPGVLLFGVLLGQRFPGLTRALFGAQLTGLIDTVPRLDGRIFLGLLVADVYVFATFLRLKRRLRQKDVRSHERAAAL